MSPTAKTCRVCTYCDSASAHANNTGLSQVVDDICMSQVSRSLQSNIVHFTHCGGKWFHVPGLRATDAYASLQGSIKHDILIGRKLSINLRIRNVKPLSGF